MKKIFWIVLLIVLTITCQEESKTSSISHLIQSDEIVEKPDNVSIRAPKVPENRKIIWTGNLELQVSNVEDVTNKISDIATKYDAFVSDMNMSSTNYEISNRITVRVKNKDFTNLINDIKGNSIFTRKIEIRSNDVTEEFVDIESRLKTKKEVRERYIDILINKTGKIKDVIEAEDAIRKITEEIEAKEGRLRYLSDKVDFSTVNILIFQEVDYKNEPKVYKKSYFSKTKDALKNGWSIITNFLLILFNIWPLIIIGILIIWKRKWIKRGFKKE